jgi:murein DD-endopeptidase MepM/ murein hydrolase activator NlpD
MPAWLLLTLVVAQAPAAEPSLGTARALVAQLRSGEVRAAWATRSPALARQFATEAQLRRFSAGLRSYGAEARVVSEGLAPEGELTVYRRVMAVANWARGLELELALDAQGRLARAGLKTAAAPAPTMHGAYRVQTALRVPLADEWFVLWGGRTWEDNKHGAVSDMRFALDLLQLRNGAGVQGARNEDYPAWGQPVLAPADGVVVLAHDGVADNPPNKPVGGNLYGNVLVLDHGNGEYSLLGHLQRGSLAVREGDRVARGERLARVGSSGMSTEPHLHYQLMDGPDWRTAHGLPVVFTELRRNGAVVERAEPRRGDRIAPLVREAAR